MTTLRSVGQVHTGGPPRPASWTTWANLGTFALIGVVSTFASGHPGDNVALLALIGASAALVTAWIGVSVHELGHAVASALLGGPVLQLRIGSGPVLVSRRLFGAKVILRLLPTDGATLYLRPIGSAVRARLLIRAGAGVLGNAALMALAVALLSGYLVPIILFVNAWMILCSLAPYTARPVEGSFASDGLVVIRLVRMPL